MAYAQFNCRYEKFDTESGLSHNRITHIIRDKEGFIWTGSWDGLNRYDGRVFKTYKTTPGDASSVANDRIDFIIDDEAGGIWVKCSDRQIYRFDKATGQFDPFINTAFKKRGVVVRNLFFVDKGIIGFSTENDGAYLATINAGKKISLLQFAWRTKATMVTDSVHFIYSDSQKHIWIGSSSGLLGLVRSAKYKYKIVYRYQNQALTGVTDRAEDASSLYFCTTKGTLLQVNKQTLKTTITKISNNRISTIKRSKFRSVLYCATDNGNLIQVPLNGAANTSSSIGAGLQIYSIYEDRSGTLWLEPGQPGVIRFDPVTQTSKWFKHRTDGNENGTQNYHVFEDQTGRVWINLQGGGLGYFNPDKNVIDCEFTDTQGLKGHFPGLVYSVYFDPAGIIWLCTEQGIVKINVPNGEFRQQAIKPHQMLDLQANEVRGLFTDKLNRLWVGTRNGSLRAFQGSTEIKIHFDGMTEQGFGSVYQVFEDSKANLWIGTKRNGLFKAMPLNATRNRYKVFHFLPDGFQKNSPTINNNVISLLEDKAGRLWAGSFGRGLYHVVDINGKTKLISIKALPGMPALEKLKIRHMQVDVHNNLWLATTTGLYIVNITQQHMPYANVVQYAKLPGNAESLGENDIQYILQSHDRRMWLATSGGGLELAKFTDPLKKISFVHHIKNDGLLSDYILSVQEDFAGELWLGTERGLTRFNPVNGSSRAYDSSEGLFGTAFSEGAVTRQQSGEIVFGTFKGILRFNPSKLLDDRTTTRLAFTNLQVNNQDVVSGAKRSVLPRNIEYTSHINLNYNENTISLDYTILDFEHGADQNIMYRLTGYDNNWQNNLKQRRVTYTNLPPGDYVLELKCVNEKFYTNIPVKRLHIYIAPPFWRTWWAYLVYVLCTGGVILVILRTIKTILKLRESVRVEKKVVELKEDFFTNISHELRTTLTLITNPLNEIGQKEQLSTNGRKYFRLITRNTERLTMFMNQWLDLRKIQSKKAELSYAQTELVAYITHIAKCFEGYGNNISLQITNTDPQIFTAIDRDKIDLVFYNILSNACKYSKQGSCVHVHIIAADVNGNIQIVVSDEGIGVPNQKLDDIFKLYYVVNAKDRTGNKGTGIGLAVAREIVNLHGGKIWAENNARSGLSIFITLPVIHLQTEDLLPTRSSAMFCNLDSDGPLHEFDLVPVMAENPEIDQPTVLLVEDNIDLRELLAGQLAEFYNVISAPNGEDGLKMAVEHNPNLIICDIMMPKMNGIAMLNKLKNKRSTSHIPIILLTAKCSVKTQIEGLKYGADYYLTKPFNTSLLLAAIANLIKQRQAMFNKLADNKVVDLSPGQVVITSKDEMFLKHVIKIVEEGMHNPLFSIETVADAMAMGRTSFYKKFKSLTGVTTVDFIRDMRLKRAQQLMDAGEDRVAMIALEVGFSNSKYFSTCFKEKYHISPTDYLKSLHNLEKTIHQV